MFMCETAKAVTAEPCVRRQTGRQRRRLISFVSFYFVRQFLKRTVIPSLFYRTQLNIGL
jgi:hypothetical protein